MFKHPEKTMAVNPKTLDFSSLSEFLVGTGGKTSIFRARPGQPSNQNLPGAWLKNPNLGLCLAFRESQWQYDRAGLEPDGTHSYGLFQIHLVAHPEISISSATDPVIATEWSAQQIAAGHVGWWTTYHEYCDSLQLAG
jgi:N-acetyl-anhydromuramyl-L-alanine amidase AmpD